MPDTVNGLLKSKLPVHGHEYDVCQNGCKLFKMNDDSDDSCKFCKKGRYSADEKKKAQTMKIISIGDHLAGMLSNPKTRDMFSYRTDRLEEQGVYKDVFDGQVYKDLKKDGQFEGELDIAVALFVDGFVHQKKGKQSKTIVHALIYNIEPSER